MIPRFTTVLLAAVTAVVLEGCATEHRAGVVGWQKGLSVGAFAPDIPFTAADGTRTTFNKEREPIAIVVFVSPPGEMCCWVNPELVSLANKTSYLRLTIVQVSEPTGECPHGAGCAQACNLDQGRLMSLCDKDRVAWKAYGEPKPNTVILVDQHSEVIDISTLDKMMGPLFEKAKQMSMPRRQRYTPGSKPG